MLSFYVRIKIALSRDKVRVLIKILEGDHWAFVFRGSLVKKKSLVVW